MIGGGPAGLAAALAARRHGLDVLVADRAHPPVDKACGEGLMPDGVDALRELGVTIGPETGFPFRGIRFLDGGLSAAGTFRDRCGLGILRVDLHRVLCEQAEEAGVATSWGAAAQVISPGSVRIGNSVIHCRWIVGADGIHSRVRRWMGLQPVCAGPRRIGIRQHFRMPIWSDLVEVYWSRNAQAYVTPVAPDEVCVAVLVDGSRARWSETMRLFPELRRRLAGAERIAPARGAISMSMRLQRVTRGQVALIGDASGSVDAVTGEGVSLALRQAMALGTALANSDLAAYERAHARISRRPHLAARLLLNLGAHETWRSRVLRTLGTSPRLFERMLEAHTGRTGVVRIMPAIANLALRSALLPQQAMLPQGAAGLGSTSPAVSCMRALPKGLP